MAKADKLDKAIEQAYYVHGAGTQINIMDIGKLFRDVRADVAGGAELVPAVQAAISRYRA